MAQQFLNTPLSDLLNIRYPVMSAGMNDCSGPELVAAVSNAGGLGSLGTGRGSPDFLRSEIRKIKALTDKPFAVQFPARPTSQKTHAELPREHIEFINKLKEEFNIPAPTSLPRAEDEWWIGPTTVQAHHEMLQIILSEQVPVVVTFYGSPELIVGPAHEAGTKVMSLVGNVRHARRCMEAGADVLVATGYGAGGHEGEISTMALVPQVVDAVKQMGKQTLVMAAGGIMDGRGLVAALALGAVGVSCGTAFLLSPECQPFRGYIPFTKGETPESWYADFMRCQIIAATDEDTSQQAVYSGGPMRTLNNAFKQAWTRLDAPPALDPALQPILVREFLRGAYEARRTELLANSFGQGVGMLRESLPAAEVVRKMIKEASLIIGRMAE